MRWRSTARSTTASASSKPCSAISRFRDEMRLSGVNSINWARILAQIVYYFVAAVTLGAPERAVSFAVPTGNFGDILAGYYAKRMGLPIERLIIATNENDILARALASGRYEPRGVKATQSPSMDIRCPRTSSACCSRRRDRIADAVRGMMADFASRRLVRRFPPATLGAHPRRFRRRARGRGRVRRGNDARLARMRARDRSAQRSRRRARRGARSPGRPTTPVVALGTAHPAKFPDAVERATGVRPRCPPISPI